MAASKDMMPQFLPFNVQRRALDANGKVASRGPLDLVGNYAAAFQYQYGSEPEDPALKDVIFKGLVMSRPQTRRGEYGRPRLSKIDESLGGLLKSEQRHEYRCVTPLEQKLKGGGFDPFGQVTAAEDNKPEAKAGNDQPATGDKKEVLVPDYCLIRFIDADDKLKPGMTYEYRLQIKVANPNYGKPKDILAYPSLAEDKDLTSAVVAQGGQQGSHPGQDGAGVLLLRHRAGRPRGGQQEEARPQALHRRQGRDLSASPPLARKSAVEPRQRRDPIAGRRLVNLRHPGTPRRVHCPYRAG